MWRTSVNEQGNTVTAHRFDAEAGTLEIFQNVSTLPPDYTQGGATAHVEVHPNGRWAYASNRGHDSIVAFTIAADGALSAFGHYPVRRVRGRSTSIHRGRTCIVPARLPIR